MFNRLIRDAKVVEFDLKDNLDTVPIMFAKVFPLWG